MIPRWRFGLLGERIQYTKSPAIFEAIGQYLGEPIQFDVHDVNAIGVASVLNALRSGELDGLSVTIPHKETVMPLIDSLSSDTQQIGAVNSIGRVGQTLEGHNTDWAGFCVPLLASKEKLAGKQALIFGAGGAARACVFALRSKFAVSEFVVVSRSDVKRAAVERAAGSVPATFLGMDKQQDWMTALQDSAIVVNATPLGGGNAPDGGELLEAMPECRDRIYYDLNYSDNNQLAAAAEEVGAIVIDGKCMLVAQAIASMRLWTGVEVSFESVIKAVFPSTARRFQ